MILIIAEKPSLARNIAAGLGDFRRRDGYLEAISRSIGRRQTPPFPGTSRSVTP
ncbi:MAG: hypothetical protein II373_04390 [Clostridia bacterium]|nr:hypothetical protein [Clostridia bacterium]